MMRPMPLIAAALLAAALLWMPAAARADALAPYLGSYVGLATVYNQDGVEIEQREVDILIRRAPRDGFTIIWTNLTLVDGRRDVPGVVRRLEQVTFYPGDLDGVYVEEMRGSLFERRRDPQFTGGDPLRWARINDDRITVFALALLDDGQYELQSYDRILTPEGLRLVYERRVEGRLERRIEGRAVRLP